MQCRYFGVVINCDAHLLQGMHAEAEPLFKRSLAIDEKAYGPDHPDVASDLKNLAGSMWSQVKNIC